MATNESIEFFHRSLSERFQKFRVTLQEFLQILTKEEQNRKIEAAKAVVVCTDNLKSFLAERDRPNWLKVLEEKIKWYIEHGKAKPNSGLEVVNTLLHIHHQIESQKWQLDKPTDTAIDFAAVYEEYYNDSRVPELFDELVSQLEQLIDSEELDSRKTIKSLQKLIATVRKNAKRDYFSTRGTWEFTQLFFRNLTFEFLESIPGIKHVVKALRKTLKEIDLEMSEVNSQVQKRLSELTQCDNIPLHDYHSVELPPASHNSDSKATASPKSLPENQ